jgi:hypothetical protein
MEAGLLELLVGMDDAQWMAGGGACTLYRRRESDSRQGLSDQTENQTENQTRGTGASTMGSSMLNTHSCTKKRRYLFLFGGFLQFTHNFNENCITILISIQNRNPTSAARLVLFTKYLKLGLI